MDDFLYNLRTGNLRRGDRDGRQGRSQYKGPQRRTGGDRRQKGPDREDISAQLNSIEKSLKTIASDQRRIADAAEREADAIDLIAHYFQREKKTATESDTPQPEAIPPSPEPALADSEAPLLAGQEMGRTDVLDLIKQLRSQKMSYAKIAEHLEAHAIPTLSGRGKWYSTTVSKLLQGEGV
jgi:hypothetical protein